MGRKLPLNNFADICMLKFIINYGNTNKERLVVMAEWKEVYLSEDYVVSNEGEVARVKDGLVLKQYPQKSGYVNVWLRLPWGNKSFPVHRLVCIAFHGIGGYEQGLFVDHIDTNRANNHADNLRWVTPKENSNNPLTLKKRRKKL